MLGHEEGCCFGCQKITPLVPASWDPSWNRQLCVSCFRDVNNDDDSPVVLAFDVRRGTLMTKWLAEGFTDFVATGDGKLHVLEHSLDAHHRKLMAGPQGDPHSVPRQMVEDYRTSGALYEAGARAFAEEMGWLYALQ